MRATEEALVASRMEIALDGTKSDEHALREAARVVRFRCPRNGMA